MSYEPKDGSGALFKNHEKESDKHPDYRGSILIGGQEYWLSAWLNTSKKGTKYLSLSAKAKDEQRDPAPKVPESSPAFDDDLPF